MQNAIGWDLSCHHSKRRAAPTRARGSIATQTGQGHRLLARVKRGRILRVLTATLEKPPPSARPRPETSDRSGSLVRNVREREPDQRNDGLFPERLSLELTAGHDQSPAARSLLRGRGRKMPGPTRSAHLYRE